MTKRATPAAVETAFRLVIAQLVLDGVAVVPGFILSPYFGRYAGLVVAAVLIELVFVVGTAVLALQMRKGHHWGRVAVTVLTILSITVWSRRDRLFGAGVIGTTSVVLWIIELLLVVVAVAMMFRPVSNAFFQRHARSSPGPGPPSS